MELPLTLGAEPKKVVILLGLLAVAGGAYLYTGSGDQSGGGGTPAVAPRPAGRALLTRDAELAALTGKPSAAPPGAPMSREFKPSLKRKPSEALDPEHYDPALHRDVLVRMAGLHVAAVDRSLFDFVAPPAPAPAVAVRIVGPEPPPPPPPPAPVAPPQPIMLKFVGLALPLPSGIKRVFCLQDDAVVVTAEGELVQHRYRIEKINDNTVVVEDTRDKHRQTLPIGEPAKGGA